jgi:BolA protein
MNMRERILTKLHAAFDPEVLDVVDDSEAHRGHGGYREGGNTHFNVTIKSSAFNGLNRVSQQRMINKELVEEFECGLHALALSVRGTDG